MGFHLVLYVNPVLLIFIMIISLALPGATYAKKPRNIFVLVNKDLPQPTMIHVVGMHMSSFVLAQDLWYWKVSWSIISWIYLLKD